MYSARRWRHHAAQCEGERCLNLACHSFNPLNVLSSPGLCPYTLLVSKQEISGHLLPFPTPIPNLS